MVTPWSDRSPSAADLTKLKLKGFVLDGTILSVTRKLVGDSYEFACDIKVSLATYPGNSMKAFYTGGASLSVSASGFSSKHEEGIHRDIVEGAAQGAREHIAQSYLSSQ